MQAYKQEIKALINVSLRILKTKKKKFSFGFDFFILFFTLGVAVHCISLFCLLSVFIHFISQVKMLTKVTILSL